MSTPNKYCGWRPLVTQTLMCGALLSTVLTISFADEKHTRHQRPEKAPVERPARTERQPAGQNKALFQMGTGQERPVQSQGQPHIQPSVQLPIKAERPVVSNDANGGGRNGATFHPNFNRDPQRVVAPLTANSTLPDAQAQRLRAGAANQIAFLAKDGDKSGKGDRGGSKGNPEKPPRVETPRIEHPRPVKPQVVKPHVEKPVVEIPRVEQPRPVKPAPQPKIENPPKIDVPRVPRGSSSGDNSDKKAGDPIRIRKPAVDQPAKIDVPSVTDHPIRIRDSKPAHPTDRKGGDPAIGKIKIKTPKSDAKLDSPADKTPDNAVDKNAEDKNTVRKNVGKGVDGSVRLKDGATLSRDHHEQIKRNLDKQHSELVKQGKATEHVKVKLPPQVKIAGTERLQKTPREALRVPVHKNGKIDPDLATKLKLRPAHEVLNTRLKNGDFEHLAKVKSGQKLQLHKQFQLHQQGDVSRRMNLMASLQLRGGWRHRHFGPISPLYTSHCHSMWYAGPSFYAAHVWYPGWSPWVDWCWWDTCAPLYDPRPIYCQPVVYQPCTPWVGWEFPTWQPLPYVTCGTWVDVEPVVINSGIDLQLLATRFVDPGHPEQELGPRFRVWIRNNSPLDLNQEFNVMLIASTDTNAYAGLPEAGVRVLGLRAGETQSIDIRLPYAANTIGRDSSGNPIPFTYLTALVDSHNELTETVEANNGATLIRGDILPVDPAAFAAEPSSAQPNGIIHVAGEGLGPEPGQAMVVIGDQEFQAEILGWFDLGVQIRLPDFELESPTAADLVIIRGDGAASNPLTIEIDPSTVVPETAGRVGPQLPDPPPLPEPAF